MDLLHLVDRLEELVANAQKMPIGNRAIIDRRRLLDIVDQMRVAIPEEVLEAKRIASQRVELQHQAEEEAQVTVARAEEQAARLVDQHELTEAARERATSLEREAEARLEARIGEANADIQQRIRESRRIAEEQMTAADDYARELLTRLERQLQAFTTSVRSGIEQLRPEPAPPESASQAAERAVAGELEAAAIVAEDVETQPPVALHAEPPPQAREFENLLDASAPEGADAGAAPAPVAVTEAAPAEPALIDDFANPSLDDDPNAGSDDQRTD